MTSYYMDGTGTYGPSKLQVQLHEPVSGVSAVELPAPPLSQFTAGGPRVNTSIRIGEKILPFESSEKISSCEADPIPTK